jgi:hypothetical protein
MPHETTEQVQQQLFQERERQQPQQEVSPVQQTQQETPFLKTGFGRAAMHIMAGAAAGIGGRDGADALARGIQVGTALQGSYLRDEQFKRDSRRQQEGDELRRVGLRLDNQYKQKRLENAFDDDGKFLRNFQVLRNLTAGQTMKYKRESFERLTRRQPSDGTITYPIDENQAGAMQRISKGAETLSELDVLFFSLDQAESGNEQAKFISRALLTKSGMKVITADSGNRFIKTPFGTFPFEHDSAAKIKALYERDIFANEQKLQDIWQTRGKASSGAQKFMLNRIGGMDLDAKQSIQVAETYARDVASNPLQARSLNFAHTADRVLNQKDPGMLQYELPELLAEFKRGSVEFHQAKNGDFYVDGKSFNRYINKFNSGDDVKILDEANVKVDKNMIEDIMNRSGLNSKAEQYIQDAATISNMRSNSKAQAMEAEFAADFRKKISTQRAAAAGEGFKEEAAQNRIQRDIKQGRLAKHSFETIVDNLTYPVTEEIWNVEKAQLETVVTGEIPISQNPELIEEFENDAAKFAFRAKKNARSFNRFAAAYKNQFGGDLRKVIDSKSDEPKDIEDRKQAFSWMKQQGEEFSKIITDKTVETFKKNQIRKFMRNPQKFIKERLGQRQAVQGFNEQQQRAVEQQKKFNRDNAETASDITSRIIGSGEE